MPAQRIRLETNSIHINSDSCAFGCNPIRHADIDPFVGLLNVISGGGARRAFDSVSGGNSKPTSVVRPVRPPKAGAKKPCKIKSKKTKARACRKAKSKRKLKARRAERRYAKRYVM